MNGQPKTAHWCHFLSFIVLSTTLILWNQKGTSTPAQSHVATQWLHSYQPEREINMVPGDMTETDRAVPSRKDEERIRKRIIVNRVGVSYRQGNDWMNSGVCQLHFITNAYEMWLLLFFYTHTVCREGFISFRSGDYSPFKSQDLNVSFKQTLGTHNQRWL